MRRDDARLEASGRLAILQGRLLPPVDGRIQAFPGAEWPNELAMARQVGVDAIEWIFEASTEDANPLTTARGIDAIRHAAGQHGVAVRSICADWFMDRPLIRCTHAERAEREQKLVWLLGQSERLGVERIVLPFVDASAIHTADERDIVRDLLLAHAADAGARGIELHLETDMSPATFGAFLDSIAIESVRVNYDSGNSASLGFRVADEFAAYGARVGSVHLKDRVHHGGTVPLGTGDADFDALFDALRAVGYAGDLVLQVARGASGAERDWARTNVAFFDRFLRRA